MYSDNDHRFYKEEELAYIIDMFRTKHKEFKKANMIEPFFNKCFDTLAEVMRALNMEKHFKKIVDTYREVWFFYFNCLIAKHIKYI